MIICKTLVSKSDIPSGRIIFADTSSTREAMIANAFAAGYEEAEVEVVELPDEEYGESLAAQPKTVAEANLEVRAKIEQLERDDRTGVGRLPRLLREAIASGDIAASAAIQEACAAFEALVAAEREKLQ